MVKARGVVRRMVLTLAFKTGRQTAQLKVQRTPRCAREQPGVLDGCCTPTRSFTAQVDGIVPRQASLATSSGLASQSSL
jgi:hypothetical protein